MNAANARKLSRGLLVLALVLAIGLFALDRYARAAHIPTAEAKEVVLYTTTWCGYCNVLRMQLDGARIPYREYDVEKSWQGVLGFWALRGRGVPVSAVGPQVIYGYQANEISRALTALGHPALPGSDKP